MISGPRHYKYLLLCCLKSKEVQKEFKKIINDVQHGKRAACDVAAKHGVHKSLVTKWKQDEEGNISYEAERREKRLLKKGRASKKHHAVFVKLHQRFVKARCLGRRVSYAWFCYVNTSKIDAELWVYPNVY